MASHSVPRRNFLGAAAGSLAVAGMNVYARAAHEASGQTQRNRTQPMPGKFPVKAISSANGLEATRRAYELASSGTDTLEAAIAGVSIVEADPEDTSVGYGGLPNEDGVVELDAAVMHGPSHRAGAVAALQNIKHPAAVARLVLEQSDHVLLVGEGALRFAKAHGFPEENLLTDKARKIWLYWKQTLSPKDDWLPPPDDKVDADVSAFFEKYSQPAKSSVAGAAMKQASARTDDERAAQRFERPTGTIHCGVMNANGDISCTTTTSGLAFKIPGRVGDSPIIGAGLYCDNEIGSCGSTGRGEANLQNLCSFAGVELMRGGLSPLDAGMEVLRRVAAHTTEKHLLDEEGRPNFGLKFYLLGKDGTHAGVSMWGPAKFAVTDRDGTRHEQCESLYEREA